MRAQFEQNFRFFGAPIGLLVTIDRRLEKGSWVDLGMFLQNVCLADQGRGLATCVQAAFAPFHKVIRPIANLPDDQVLVCGISLGLEDGGHAANALRTERADMRDWVSMIRWN